MLPLRSRGLAEALVAGPLNKGLFCGSPQECMYGIWAIKSKERGGVRLTYERMLIEARNGVRNQRRPDRRQASP